LPSHSGKALKCHLCARNDLLSFSQEGIIPKAANYRPLSERYQTALAPSA
jgi:hypothetical protein